MFQLLSKGSEHEGRTIMCLFLAACSAVISHMLIKKKTRDAEFVCAGVLAQVPAKYLVGELQCPRWGAHVHTIWKSAVTCLCQLGCVTLGLFMSVALVLRSLANQS